MMQKQMKELMLLEKKHKEFNFNLEGDENEQNEYGDTVHI